MNLKLPKKDRPKGLFLYCNSCKRCYSDQRKVKCRCQDLAYKAIVHVAGTKRDYKSQILDSVNFSDAVREFHDFRAFLKENNYQRKVLVVEKAIPVRLIECFAYYIGFLNNVNVPDHKHKERDPKYIARVDNVFETYKSALQANGIDCMVLKFSEVTDELVGYVHRYFLKEKEYANKTYNNNMAILSAFTTHVIEEFNLTYKNPFLGVPDLIVRPKVTSLVESEFERLMEIITPENGATFKMRAGRKNPARDNLYKSWLKEGIKLGLYTGGRSEDVVELKWSDIRLDEKGRPETIKTVDHKIDKAKNNLTGNDGHFEKYFAVTKELEALLLDMGYEKYKGTQKYILAPEDNLKRTHVAALLSRAFSHYYRQLNTGKTVTFKNLRKTYMTSALSSFGEASTALTNHATIDMTVKHYQDKEVTRAEARQNFSVFKKKAS